MWWNKSTVKIKSGFESVEELELHLEPRKEFLLQDPVVADWLMTASASVGVPGAEPPKERTPALGRVLSKGFIRCSTADAVTGSFPPLSVRIPFTFTLPLPARTHTHTHRANGQHQTMIKKRWKNKNNIMPGSVCVLGLNKISPKSWGSMKSSFYTLQHTHLSGASCFLLMF